MVEFVNGVIVKCGSALKPDIADFSHIFFCEEKAVRWQDKH
jgi:hypothetical protein